MSKQAALALFHDLDALAKQQNVSIGIGPAMMAEKDDPAQADLLGEILGLTSNVYGSLIVAGSDGVHSKSVHAAAEIMKYLEDHSDKGLGNFRFAAIANVQAYTPFYPASYHQGLGHQFAIALESANVVAAVMAVRRDAEVTRQVLISELGRHAQAVEDIASKIDQETGWAYMGIDLSPAPMKYASIGSAVAGFTGGRFGASGTLTAVATITSALRDISVKKVGYSGVMMPVLEDTRLAPTLGRGRPFNGPTPRLFRGLRHRTRHDSPARRHHHAATRTHHRRRRHPFREIIETAQRAPPAGAGREGW